MQIFPSPSFANLADHVRIKLMRPFLSLMIATSLSASAQESFSPVVQTDHSIVFRLKAPDAKEVTVQLEGLGTKPLTKDEAGVWSFTSPPLEPDLYSYTFTRDGEKITDPANTDLKTGIFGNESIVTVNGGTGAPWEVREVPHGKLEHHSYRSQIAAHDRELIVYTPPGYDPKTDKPLPVLFLLHGFSDEANAWSTIGRANVILDNLIAEQKALPMVVVMPLGYGDMSVVAGGWENRNKDGAWEKNLSAFDKTLLEEVMPLAEAKYAIRKDSAGRGVAGLSMGGAEALQSGFLHSDLFGWVGAFSSGGVPTDLDTAFPEAGKQPYKLLWISCGKDDGLIGANRALVSWLDKKQIKHTWTETEGAHRWNVWRRNLATFVQLAFRE